LQIHQLYSDSLQTASGQMIYNLGDFTSTFAPQLPADNNDQVFKDLLDVLSLMFGVISNYEWNVGESIPTSLVCFQTDIK
jgi:hypothetical protein